MDLSKHKNLQMLRDLTEIIDEALDLLEESRYVAEPAPKHEVSPASLLSQCISLCARQTAIQSEPIRTVHHFACTGGTLISKCLAAMPNTNLISEIDPLSALTTERKAPRFAPTDMIKLIQQSTRGAHEEMILEVFLDGLAVIYTDAVQRGQRLVLRDHAHSHFCRGRYVSSRPSLRDIVGFRFPVVSAVTVRDPIDSYLSLIANGWRHFSPQTFDEYCLRYIIFLDTYQSIPLFRYEDLVADPPSLMKRICEALELPYEEHFLELFHVFNLTGDSGRSGVKVGVRKRRIISDAVQEEIDGSVNYKKLAKRLCYS